MLDRGGVLVGVADLSKGLESTEDDRARAARGFASAMQGWQTFSRASPSLTLVSLMQVLWYLLVHLSHVCGLAAEVNTLAHAAHLSIAMKSVGTRKLWRAGELCCFGSIESSYVHANER